MAKDKLTTSDLDDLPSLSPDRKWVVYRAEEGNYLAKVPLEGGDAVHLTNNAGYPDVSPDGKLIACRYQDTQANFAGVAVLPSEGGAFTRTFNIPWSDSPLVRWTPDGHALAYLDMTLSSIWTQPLDGGPPKKLVVLKPDQIMWLDWSRDGKQLALARGARTSDVVLIKNFR